MTKNTRTKAQSPAHSHLSQTQVEKIRERAYELYEARGREDGHEVEDWLQAESEFGMEN